MAPPVAISWWMPVSQSSKTQSASRRRPIRIRPTDRPTDDRRKSSGYQPTCWKSTLASCFKAAWFGSIYRRTAAKWCDLQRMIASSFRHVGILSTRWWRHVMSHRTIQSSAKRWLSRGFHLTQAMTVLLEWRVHRICIYLHVNVCKF